MGSDLVLPLENKVKIDKTSFRYSFSFLPRARRNALRTIYAFCRITDDIVDNVDKTQSKMEALHKWRIEFENSFQGGSNYPFLNKLTDIIKKFNIPIIHFYDLLRGVEIDLLKNRYETFEELKEYCYLVASSVGLVSLKIFGSDYEKTKEYAVNLGIALQLTNIIRDVAIDAHYGRIYIPLEDLRKFGYSEEDLFSHKYNDAFISLMKFQVERADLYYSFALESLPREYVKTMFAAKIMERIYYHILLRIKKRNYNVFDKSLSTPKFLQILIALKYWIKHRLLGW